MLPQGIRQAILDLHQRGQGVRAIARALQVSRAAVRDILRRGSAEVPRLARPERALEHREEILRLLRECEGSFLRVHEELAKAGLQLSYPAFTAFCRRHGIGQTPRLPAGRYDFAPGQEMQHDTSPHDVHLGGRVRRVQTASLVLGYSRLLFFQFYPRFRRFECKVFLTEAFRYLDGVAQTCLIDNTHVVVLRGTGPAMIPVPEMAAFAERFGFTFVAHAVGDANRSGRVERMFRFIERGFLPGRRFTDWAEANRQARAWCDRVNARPKRQLKASPRELFAVEHPALRRLPRWIPEPYLLHEQR
jgi:transposase